MRDDREKTYDASEVSIRIGEREIRGASDLEWTPVADLDFTDFEISTPATAMFKLRPIPREAAVARLWGRG